MRDLFEYFSLPLGHRLEEAGLHDEDDEDRAELERLGVHFEEGDTMLDADERDWDDGGYAQIEGGMVEEEDNLRIATEDELDDWDDWDDWDDFRDGDDDE